MERFRITALILALGMAAGGGVAQASETGPVIVIPGRAGVPVIVNGRDVSYAVIEGDWGLDRPSQTNPRVIYRYFVPPSSFKDVPPAHYFPGGGPPPRLGRKEVDVPRPIPQQPAPTTYRDWSTQSDPTPATSPTPLAVPGTIVVPEDFRWRSRP